MSGSLVCLAALGEPYQVVFFFYFFFFCRNIIKIRRHLISKVHVTLVEHELNRNESTLRWLGRCGSPLDCIGSVSDLFGPARW